MKQTEFFKRLFSAMLLIVMALSVLPTAQAEGQHGYVLIPGSEGEQVVNFRRDPNTDDNGNYPIARLPEYWVVEILGTEINGGRRWYRVQTNTGVGENDQTARAEICKYFGYLGVKVNPEANATRGQDIMISTEDSPVKVFVIPTNEELVIARDTRDIVG